MGQIPQLCGSPPPRQPQAARPFHGLGAKEAGLPGKGTADILDVKCDPIPAGSPRSSGGFLPAYHMNKERRITILPDGAVPRDEVIALLNISYNLTKR